MHPGTELFWCEPARDQTLDQFRQSAEEAFARAVARHNLRLGEMTVRAATTGEMVGTGAPHYVARAIIEAA